MDEAAALLRTLIERNPLSAFRHRELGLIEFIQGHQQEALERFERARKVAMRTDAVEFLGADLAAGYLANGRFADAIELAQRTATEFPADAGQAGEQPWLVLIAALSANGQADKAHAELQRFLATPRTWHSMAAIGKVPFFAASPNLLAGLRAAGMAEQ